MGAVIVGAAASAYAIYKTQPKHVALPPIAEPYEKAAIVRVSHTGATGPTDSVGYYHNKLLASIGIDKIVAANYADIERLVVDAANKLGQCGKFGRILHNAQGQPENRRRCRNRGVGGIHDRFRRHRGCPPP